MIRIWWPGSYFCIEVICCLWHLDVIPLCGLVLFVATLCCISSSLAELAPLAWSCNAVFQRKLCNSVFQRKLCNSACGKNGSCLSCSFILVELWLVLINYQAGACEAENDLVLCQSDWWCLSSWSMVGKNSAFWPAFDYWIHHGFLILSICLCGWIHTMFFPHDHRERANEPRMTEWPRSWRRHGVCSVLSWCFSGCASSHVSAGTRGWSSSSLNLYQPLA